MNDFNFLLRRMTRSEIEQGASQMDAAAAVGLGIVLALIVLGLLM
jgi:hypothetical protein